MRRPFLQQRRRIFIGCEGESERSYIALVQRLLGNEAAFHLVSPVLNGGDPLATVESANKAVRKEVQHQRGVFIEKYILLDRDLWGRSIDRDQQALALARKSDYRLIWQEPCHEAMLLRHLQNCQARRPSSSPLAMQALLREWPTYEKNAGASVLAQRIDLPALQRAAAVEAELRHLLVLLELA
jgi:hypothetical protein